MKKVLSSLVALLLLTSCGPMNTAPKQTGADPGTSSNQPGSITSSKNNKFFVYASFVDSSLLKSEPQLGKNAFVVRFVHSNELRPISENGKVNIVYWMPDMPEMGKSQAAGKRQADGSYLAELFFSMNGKWEIIMTLEDGNDQDEHRIIMNI